MTAGWWPEEADRLNQRLRALIEVLPDDPEPRAPGPLTGWTVAVKDNTDVRGTVRTDGLRGPHGAPADLDAEVVRRLRAAGATIAGKANLEELSFGATTQNDYWGRCRNPWDPERIPGGSSGGSAVAVAAGLVTAAIGTDTGGSLRNPAAFCGLTTIRPTHGLVPTAGVTPLSPSMDVVGPMARDAARVRLLLEVCVGAPPPPVQRSSLRKLRIGVPDTYFVDDLDHGVTRGFEGLLQLLRAEGARLVELTCLRQVGDVHAAMAALQNSEAVRHLHAHWDDPRVGAGVQGRIAAGRAVGVREVERALVVRDRWRSQVRDGLASVDVMVVPATPFVAPLASAGDLTEVSREINRFTGVWSLTGLPVVVVPVEPSPGGLPVGAQLIGAAGGDWATLAVAELVQRSSDWHELWPAESLRT